ncbi:hypothetical protein [Allokutzneria albata]|uniref:Uncharacterized protein n=1 Tax=Allokutzneria albata TaxID=211114 RepID=A0A1G9YUY8_ALLAB|nr:hypothetical protein [Allokutzneria albata]SDN12950.1 hypothetical protein SAMN04489726_5069 [Allokutzneria albata]
MTDEQQAQGGETPSRKGFSVVVFLVGLVAVWAAIYGFTKGEIMEIIQPNWLLAGAAVLVGSLMLINTLRPQRKR